MDGQQGQGNVPGEWQYQRQRPQGQRNDWQSPLLGLGLGALLNKNHPFQGALMGGMLPLAAPLIQQMLGMRPPQHGQDPMYRRRWMNSQAPVQPQAAPQPAVQMQAPPQQPVGY